MTFIFRVDVGDQQIFTFDSTQSIGATVTHRDPASGEPKSSATQLFSVTDLLQQAQTPVLDKALAIKAYVDALRSVNNLRVAAGTQAAEAALLTNPGDLGLTEIRDLLKIDPA